MTEASETLPDVRLLSKPEFVSEGVNARFPGAGPQDFRIYFTPETHRSIGQHAHETTSVEIGGVLVGHWGRDEDGAYAAVTEIIRCDAATSKSGEVTFTHEAWNVVNKEMDTRFADLKIVGWYHSHPGFGIFLSERDRFIHEHFFSNPGQIAYVIDPLAESEGVFAWRGGKPALWPCFWSGDRICATSSAETEAKGSYARSPDSASAAAPQRSERMSILSLVQSAILFVLVFLVGYLLAGMKSGWEDRMIVNGAVAHYGLWKGIRPGLRQNLEEVSARLQSAAASMKTLAADAEKATGDEADKKRVQWKETQEKVQSARMLADLIADKYSLTPEEENILAKMVADKLVELEAGKSPAPAKAEPGKNAEPSKKEEKSKQ
jgi:proteasome lid subunit RPN8/RPN11